MHATTESAGTILQPLLPPRHRAPSGRARSDEERAMTSSRPTNDRPPRHSKGSNSVARMGDAIYDDSEAITSFLSNPTTTTATNSNSNININNNNNNSSTGAVRRTGSQGSLSSGASGGGGTSYGGGTSGGASDYSLAGNQATSTKMADKEDAAKEKQRCGDKPHHHVVIVKEGGEAAKPKRFFTAKKSVSQGMMDIALITANANQLRYLLEYGKESSTYHMILTLIIMSLAGQVVVGLAMIFKSRFKDAEEKRILNSIVVISIFAVTVINVFVSSFSFNPDHKVANSPFFTNKRPLCFADPDKPCRSQCLTLAQQMPYNLTVHVCAWAPDIRANIT